MVNIGIFGLSCPTAKVHNILDYAKKMSGYGVVSRTAEGVAAEDALQSQPAATEGAVLLDGLLRILRAGGGIAACWRRQRRDAGAVEGYQRQHEP